MSGSALYETFARAPLAFDHGEGAWLVTTGGERYLDFAAGIAVNSLGHGHPHLVEALTEQAGKLWHVSNLYEIPGQRRLGERLVANSFADKVFFTNSGAEALECAIKTARRYHYVNGNPERYRIITFEGAFHGRTLATIAAGGQPKYLEGFGPKVEGFDQVALGDAEALKKAITAETAAILVEPVQGEGGIRVVPAEMLKLMRKLADDNGLLLIYDEVQCGVGRTGKLFAYEWSGAEPDIMSIAKGIGGGFPLGACLSTDEAAVGMTAGVHGTTFGGNPLAMAVGNAVMKIVADDAFLDEVNRKAGLFRQRLEGLVAAHPDVFESVRGVGLMLGLKCRKTNTDIVAAGYAENLLTVPAADNVIRLLPPLNITEDEIAEAVNRLDRAARAVEAAKATA